MKKRIVDENVKALLRQYHTGDTRCYSEILDMVSPYIYHFPRIVFCAPDDQCGEFYEYMLVRLRNILKIYRESQARFVTWFTVVLRNRYFNYLREKKNRDTVEQGYDLVSLDFRNEHEQSLYNLLGDSREYVHEGTAPYGDYVDRIVSGLRKNQRVFFHLYFIENLRQEDVGFLAVTLNRTVRDVLKNIDVVRSSMLRKYEMKHEHLSRLNMLHHAILRGQRDRNKSEVHLLKVKREKIIEEYRRVKLNPSYESIARFLDVPIGTVSTGISRMKSAVRGILKEQYDEKMSVS